MSLLMIRCPQTRQDVWTGIETDPESLQNIPDTLFYMPCPHCGFDHAWWHDEAWLTDDASPGKSVERDAPLGSPDAPLHT
jgi:hypothetical protein